MQENFATLHKASKRLSKYMFQSVFEDMTELCMRTKAINMAQGFPDWKPPSIVKQALKEAADMNEDQYTRVGGHPALVKAIAKEYGPKFGRTLDPMKEISISNGGAGLLSNFMQAFLEQGDEVILFEPTFPFVYPMVDLNGGKVRFSGLIPPNTNSSEWTYDFEGLEKLFNERTKAIVLNTPHNPTGKVTKKWEIEKLIEILKKWPQVIVVSDEVYEHVVYDQEQHIRIGSFPEMWDRTVSVYSGGKIFSVTGWRVGWGIGPSHLIRPLVAAQNWTSFSVNRPAQVAIAEALTKASQKVDNQSEHTFYSSMRETFQQRKTLLYDILKKAPFDWKLLNPEGGYFLIVDISNCMSQTPKKYFYKEGASEKKEPVGDWLKLENPDFTPDYAFVRWLLFEYGVGAIPMFPFYEPSTTGPKDQKGTSFIRFTICKEEETILAVGKKFTAS